MREFYPALEPFNKGMLKVSDIHTLYWEECGNPQGKPVVFLHGGPGGGVHPDHRRFFDPKAYRIILFDQRGSGQSLPCAELRENSTWDLVKDTETIREMLKIDKWVVFGGSWGSTLALAYAITHPERVKALVLRGIFLCRPSEIQWFYQEGASHIFPDVWDEYLKPIPENERHDLVAAYYKRLTHENADVRLEAAKAWSKWEAATSRLIVDPKAVDEFDDPEYALSFARIECHYFTNNAFFKTNNWLLENVDKIRHIPGAIVQGRYDVVCPAKSAWELHKAWPEAKFTIIPDSGHAAAEPGTRSALIEATDSFRDL
ncbi:prolyl aminopeptidase [Bdellovibrio bacteriovorus]|uniref:Proline iminopeptidase n=2 Tax=Bdellovibrio bacteriovorus TaxID=959 RepID=Q6MHR0_BDEBA|nr:prolyl aminopeptidase [Bdellovibrio bacteriovorus]AHZ83831.1 proline iminopeptidase [Bdellovibrio bacteriovorus]ASD62439.1 prolyl aminopeptidase [Bdellovibrio bacteriovorus]BEV69805.1 Proline iminopeptidase [Bdellovibrio bacteriovorus]CAE78272.1 proline iminopeptidase [Bdellovibrio bacteriovorus HD100]